MKEAPLLGKTHFFYGYWIIGVLFLLMFITGGCGIYGFSLFVNPLQAEFGWGRGDIMVGFTIFLLIMGGVSPFMGPLISRYGARIVMAAGAAILGLGFFLLTMIQHLWQYYAGYFVIALGLAAMGIVPVTTVVSNWFSKQRGTAIGVASSGIGAGGICLAPIIGGHLIPTLGWENAYLIMAIISWVIIPVIMVLVVTKPADVGLFPDGVEPAEAELVINTGASSGINLKAALSTSTFWLISAVFIMFGFISDGLMQHQVPHLEDIGFPVAVAATALGGVALASTISHPIFGWLCDRIQPKYALCLALGLKIGATLLLMNVTAISSPAMLWGYVILIGSSFGAWITTMSMLTSTNFGLAYYGILFGVISFVGSIGSAVGPLFSGYMYDSMHTYSTAFTIILIITIAAIPVTMAIRRPRLPVVSGE